ncbi:MAG: hypothetical protein ACRENE_00660 [Polyangiaceae bacterium]
MRRAYGWAQLAGAVCAAVPFALAACGSRSTLDGEIIVLTRDASDDGGGDATADALVPQPDGAVDAFRDAPPSPPDAPVDAPPLRDAEPDVRDAGPDVVVLPNCSSPSIQYIYMFTESNHIWSLYPQTGTLTLIGTLACSASGTAYSMAVDRTGSAYVLYTSSEIFHVSLRTLACTKTAWVSPGAQFDTFGMGFVGDPSGLTDTLYVASGDGDASVLGKLDLATFTVSRVGTIGFDRPELSGTGNGRLFAFYGTDDGGSSAVDEIDPSTLRHLSTYSFTNLPQNNGWAFGFWGGDFYLFTAPSTGSLITRYRPSDGSQTTIATLNETIVGAGVSTCAPQN